MCDGFCDVLVLASPKFQLHPFTEPAPEVEASVNATAGQAEVLELKFAVQVKHEIVTVFEMEFEQLLLVPIVSVTVYVPFAV